MTDPILPPGSGLDRRAALRDIIARADYEGGLALIDRYVAEIGGRALLEEVIEPVLADIGRLWEVDPDSVVLAQGYVAAKMVDRSMASIAGGEAAPLPGRVAVLGNIEDDFHALGRKLVATFLRAAGWTVHDLGNDVPPADLLDAALDKGARVIGVSAMVRSSALNIARLRELLDARGLSGRIKLAVGGAVFGIDPALVAAVGGDGTARNALGAPALFERLAGEAAAAPGEGAGRP